MWTTLDRANAPFAFGLFPRPSFLHKVARMTHSNPYERCGSAWIRGNLHGHSREGSACSSVPLLDGIARHRELGAQFLAITDHDTVSDLAAARLRWPDTIFLEGFEWSRSQNLLFIGEQVPALYERLLPDALARARALGLLTVVCHPKPSRSRSYWTIPMIRALSPAPLGIEVYNAHYGRPHLTIVDPTPLYTETWDQLLTHGMRIWGFANDDSHDPADYGCTRTMVCVSDPTPASILEALKAGRFYASTGLLLDSARIRGDLMEVVLSAPARCRFIGPGGRVLASSEGREAAYRASGEAYVRFEAEGADGRIFLQPFFALKV
jgi:hypothetical protein